MRHSPVRRLQIESDWTQSLYYHSNMMCQAQDRRDMDQIEFHRKAVDSLDFRISEWYAMNNYGWTLCEEAERAVMK